jgi:uncharacterized membrane protein
MDKELELHLTTVEKYLKSMPVLERIDVIEELKSYIEELQLNKALNSKEILARLGSPKELAAGYLGDKITMGHSFSFKKLLMVFSFYSLVSLSGMFIIPCGTVLAGGLIVCSIVGPVGGLIKLLGFLLGFDVPFYYMAINDYELHPLLAFPVAIALGVLLFFAGRAIWKAVIRYIRTVSNTKRKLDGIK